ncbi:hypothetical protein ACHAWF_010691 [Thalassiosira exigua]
MEGHHDAVPHPLHILDDLLASLPPPAFRNRVRSDGRSSPDAADADADAATAAAEATQDLVLRAACDLFANNAKLLENALALLDEQEQFQTSRAGGFGDDDHVLDQAPVIRKIRARRSGREAALIRKQRKKPPSSRRSNSKASKVDVSSRMSEEGNVRDNPQIADEYYLCLLGRDGIDRRASFASNDGWARVHRRGMHCTCRSFFQNMNGGCRTSSSKGEVLSSPICPDAVVCKHLLAAILMPHMLPWSIGGGAAEETVDDKQFAKLVMRASIG